MSRALSVTFVNANMATVSGYGSHDLLVELRHRRPVWSSISRAWATTPRTARDLIAIAESRGYVVSVEHDGPLPAAMGRLW